MKNLLTPTVSGGRFVAAVVEGGLELRDGALGGLVAAGDLARVAGDAYAFVMVAAGTTGEFCTDVLPNVIHSPVQHAWVHSGPTACGSCRNPLPTPGVK
ncbi:hypothetical protein [Streptomyces sp. NPDC127038]|uniref:hypothetical protein n=1 Tax=Streptomyces sp. NPDC127038 TaxID=3347114 RepID=UPI00364D993C